MMLNLKMRKHEDSKSCLKRFESMSHKKEICLIVFELREQSLDRVNAL